MLTLAVCELWPFHTHAEDLPVPGSIVEVLLRDRLTIGFIRAALVAVAGYVLVSVPALVIARRWIKGFGSSGLAADDVSGGETSIRELQGGLALLQGKLDDQTRKMNSLAETLVAREPDADESEPSNGGAGRGST